MTRSRRFRFLTSVSVLLSLLVTQPADSVDAQNGKSPTSSLFAHNNLVAWCIVPFDGKKRGPAARAAMCAELGLKKVAYDWRNEHVPTFEQEILEYRKHGIEYFAFWGGHEEAYKLFKKYDLHPQIWRTLGSPEGATQDDRVKAAAKQMLPLVEEARGLGCKVGLYNHGGWGGEPENLVAVCEYLRKNHDGGHVGIVYNQHHSHDRVDNFAADLKAMMPYLLCLNLNGITRDGDKHGKKILPLGEGELDVALLKIIRDSGYDGPIGIIGHTQDDVEQRLQDNLDGLDWILPQLDGKPPGPKPTPRTWSPESTTTAGSATRNVPGVSLPGKAEYRTPPITVEARVSLPSRSNYNIIVASDTKNSAAHWELFSMNGSGNLTAYTPGLKPDHTTSKAMICDGRPHNVGMTYEPNLIRLFVDGKVVASQKVESLGRSVVPGGLAIGKLVEGSIGSSGLPEWVRISKGIRKSPWTMAHAPAKDGSTLLAWAQPKDAHARHHASSNEASGAPLGKVPEYSAELVAKLLADTKEHGNAGPGVMVFANAKSACLSCHKFGSHGGTVGPPLNEIGKQRKPQEIIESVLWPQRDVKPEFKAHLVVTSEGKSIRGYVLKEDGQQLQIKDPTRPEDQVVTITKSDIEARREIGTLMPDNLTATMSNSQLRDLLKFLLSLGTPDGVPLADVESIIHHTHAHLHGPVAFEFDRAPLHPEHWPSWQSHVNRDRLYDFYAKEADHFRTLAESGKPVPSLLMEYPGLDGGELGHWGNQDETTWASNAWNDIRLGSIQAGIFRGDGVTVPRGVCVHLGGDDEISCCFNPQTLSYDAVWKGGFLKFSSVRHGFLHGVLMDGQALPNPHRANGPAGTKVTEPFTYHGFHRIGKRVVFSYRIGDTEYLDSPWIEDGKFVRQAGPASTHPLADQLGLGKRQWPESFETRITHGQGAPYAVDTIEFPSDNPWKVPLFGGGLGFLQDGSALVCTMHGDVWRISGLEYPSEKVTWNRFASGLHHCQGMIVDRDGIFVLGRDQVTRLHDLNNDGEADFYECFSNQFETSSAGHDFICGLERDANGNFYTASGNQGIVRISPDGQKADVVATGFRNPDGIGLTSDGLITVPCSEGTWTPSTMICAFRPAEPDEKSQGSRRSIPYFGYPGPKDSQVPELPLVYLPRGVDNSAGGQQVVNSDRWGPLKDQLLHFSFGTGSHFLTLKDEVYGQVQGAIVPLPGEFLSGVHRGRFSPHDGQLYVTGMQGWGSYTPKTGCFQRVRYTGESVQLPIGYRVYRNGVLIQFSAAIDESIASQPDNHFAQAWNYRYSGAYGSPEFSSRHPLMRGHDHVLITSAHVVDGGTGLFLELPDLQPVNQLHLRLQSNKGQFHDVFATVHKLRDESFTDAPGLMHLADKSIAPHPIHADLAMATRSVPNPHAKRRKGGRRITIETAGNLSFATRSLHVQPGEQIEFKLVNPDVVPHNWALLKPGTLERVGRLSNQLISDPEAAIRHYIPDTSDVLVYTNVVLPKDEFIIYFNAPKDPGRYPYLCTFPGHWLVMNGELIVDPPGSKEQRR